MRSFAPVAVGTPERYTTGLLLSGKYRLDALLGEGGMGSVWRATNLLLELPVAIKLIRADLDHSALRERLQVEARSAAKLGHPAIVRVYDVGQSEAGDPFIVMELLEGQTLAALLSQGRLSAARAVQILLPIIDALGMAHARGIVHRDLKPDNVMLALEDQHIQPKILDFGIAKLTDPRDSDHKLTEVGVVVGSPDYMSPEQARGRDDLDATTDIWSLCVVLYEAITGTAPFSAPNYNALLCAILEEEPKAISLHAAGDDRLWQIIQRGLAKDRSDRFSSMNELGRALATWLISHEVQEDACGTSLEAKWLARPSDPRSLSETPGAASPISDRFLPESVRGPRGIGTGISRGAFTSTIRPGSAGRRRAVGVVVTLCVLLLGGVTLLNHTRSETVSLASRPVVAQESSVVVREPLPLTSMLVAPSTVVPAASARSTVDTPIVQATRSMPKVHAVIKPPDVSAQEPTAKPAPSATEPPAKTVERPLDLLTPY